MASCHNIENEKQYQVLSEVTFCPIPAKQARMLKRIVHFIRPYIQDRTLHM